MAASLSLSPSATETPSASPAGSEGLAGRWAGRRISLELEARGPRRYEGTLTLRARGIPVTVREREGRWVGVLVQGEVEVEFSVARDVDSLVLVSDGRTYRLERAQELEQGASWVGTYRGPRETALSVGRSADAYAGSLELDGVRYVLAGRIEEAALVGSLRDPLTGKELTWRASDVDAEGLLFTIRLEEQSEEGRASFHALRFERAE